MNLLYLIYDYFLHKVQLMHNLFEEIQDFEDDYHQLKDNLNLENFQVMEYFEYFY